MGRPKLDKKLDGTLAFRVRAVQKRKLERHIEGIRSKLNQSSPDFYKVTSSDIILAALRKGLPLVNIKDFAQRKERKQAAKTKI